MSSGGPERIVEPEEILQGGAQICPGGLAGYLPGHGATVGGHDSGDALLIVLRRPLTGAAGRLLRRCGR